MDGYRERLTPQWWVWLIALTPVGMLAVAYGSALGTTAGVIVGIVGGTGAIWLLWITSPLILVDDAGLSVGRATLPKDAVGAVRPLDAADLREATGPGGDARVFVSLRPWSTSTAVEVTVADPADPHPAWLISTRRPDLLTAALDPAPR